MNGQKCGWLTLGPLLWLSFWLLQVPAVRITSTLR